MNAALALIHSPLVGLSTWRDVAAELARETGVVVPHAVGGTPAEVAGSVAAGIEGEGPFVLVGHSAAGRLLPRVARLTRVPVAGLVFVDAALPIPGRSWRDEADPERAADLFGRAVDGTLPPWHEWFPPAATAMLPEAFRREIPRLPVGYFTEPHSSDVWTGPAGYLLLSEAYRGYAGQAREAGWPVAESISNHLAMLTDPPGVAAALRRLLTRI